MPKYKKKMIIIIFKICLIDSNLHLFTRINTKLTTGPITWSCVNKKILNSNASKLNIQLKPKRICCDYEKAAITSFEKAYNCEFRGCLFHYTQCLLKHIKACKLFVHYEDQENKTVHKWFQLLISLPFLPVHIVEFNFNYINPS